MDADILHEQRGHRTLLDTSDVSAGAGILSPIRCPKGRPPHLYKHES